MTRGLPTAYPAPVLASMISIPDDDVAPVCADAPGIEPLYPLARSLRAKIRDFMRGSHLSMRCRSAAHERRRIAEQLGKEFAA